MAKKQTEVDLTMIETEKDENISVFMIVNNIPKNFHASDLRNFFSTFIETGGFVCFHYRHRPEIQKPSEILQNVNKELSRRVTNCCIIKVVRDRASEFIKSYNREHWIDKKGDSLTSCCFIKQLAFSQNSQMPDEIPGACKKGTVSVSLPINQETFTEDAVNALIEMHPPTCMPNGNVGTKTSHFMQEIRACRLPPSLISKLGLQFPRNRARRIYGNVPFDYKSKRNKKKSSMSVFNNIHSRGLWFEKSQSNVQEKNEDSESEEEEWDRHEALHDDVTGQERSKERLFEEKIELKWEKGGSGLVFYTDAQIWDEKEGDFDAKTADDWDIDTNIYKDPGGMDCDKDSRDLLRMRLEQTMRNGTETEIDRLYDFAAFEKFNKGFGRKLMEAQGWKQGLGIGKNCAGIAEPLFNDGQKPTDKKGFGYRGEKLCREPCAKKKRRKSFDSDDTFFISTIYDDPKTSDPPDSIFTSTAYSKLKYRREFLKEQGDKL